MEKRFKHKSRRRAARETAEAAAPLPPGTPVTATLPAPTPWVRLGLAFALAAVGQAFLCRREDPHTLYPGLVLFAFAVWLFLRAMNPWKREALALLPLGRLREALLFAGVFLVAVFFRLYRLADLPNGMFSDQGNMGLSALRILHEQFRPFYEFRDFQNPALLLYQLAAWFTVAPATKTGFDLFFALMGLATVPLAYWFFRQLAGPRQALVAIFLFAVMRWHFNFSRNGFPTVQVPFYLSGLLAFILHGLRTGKRRFFVLSALFLSAGLYGYNAFKAVPLLLIALGLYEWFRNGRCLRGQGRNLAVFVLVSAALVSPLWARWAASGIGDREANNSLLSEIRTHDSYQPVKEMLAGTALMFNRTGDDNERHNSPNHRMLDDVSGVLFVLGFFYALWRWKRRKYFYVLAGFGVMSLPCLLSIVPAHANRMLGAAFFAAFLASAPVAAVWGSARRVWGLRGEAFFLALLALPLGAAAYQNYRVYFVEQPAMRVYWEYGFWSGYSAEASAAGRLVAREGDDCDFALSPRFYPHPTVSFLGYAQRSHMRMIQYPQDLALPPVSPGRDFCLVVPSQQDGYLQAIRYFWPGGTLRESTDAEGRPSVSLYRVPWATLESVKGLEGDFVPGGRKRAGGFPDLLPDGPYRAVLNGSLYIPQPGRYRLSVSSNSQVGLKVDGKAAGVYRTYAAGFYPVEATVAAGPGPVRLRIALHPAEGDETVLGVGAWTTRKVGGLEAEYYSLHEWKGNVMVHQWDPVVQYDTTLDFPFRQPEISARWKGTLTAPKSGDYEIWVDTADKVWVCVDGKEIIRDNFFPKTRVFPLAKGPHAFELRMDKDHGPDVTLLWKPPGAPATVVVPNEAFGLPQSR